MARAPLSVVVPVYNEAGNIADVVAEAVAKLAPHVALQMIVVDDGSDDGTAEALARVHAADADLRVIRHPRRSGKSAALRTGALAAAGPWIATMDGDGQNDPADIRRMTEAVDLQSVGRVGLVAGIRRKRNDGASRKLASRFANGLRRRLLKDDCPDTACGLKLIPRAVFLALPFYDSLHRYLPAWVRHLGFETRYVDVDDRPRGTGRSKYSNLGRGAAGIVDLLGVSWLMRRTSVPAPHLLVIEPAGPATQAQPTDESP